MVGGGGGFVATFDDDSVGLVLFLPMLDVNFPSFATCRTTLSLLLLAETATALLECELAATAAGGGGGGTLMTEVDIGGVGGFLLSDGTT